MSEQQIVEAAMGLGADEDAARASMRSYATSAAKGKSTKRITCEVRACFRG